MRGKPILRTPEKEKGFTLIEIMIAVVIMGMAYIVILQNFSLSSRNISKVESHRNHLLRNTLEFEQRSFASRLANEETSEMTESIFMEGSSYQLILVSDESESFMSLRLKKL